MYGTTMKSFNMNKASKVKIKNISEDSEETKKKLSKKETKKIQNKKYINISAAEEQTSCNDDKDKFKPYEGFSIKDLPIASVVITVILTMMMLVMLSGFGGI